MLGDKRRPRAIEQRNADPDVAVQAPQTVEEVRRRVEAGRAFKQGVAEILTANAQLLTLRRRQRGR